MKFNYIPTVWDLVKEKKFDKAWGVIQKALINLAQIISTDKWKTDPSLKQGGISWARDEIGLQVYSMYYAMAEICRKEKRHKEAALYSKIALTFGQSEAPSKVYNQAIEKIGNFKLDKDKFNKILKPWVDLKLVKKSKLL